MKVCLIHGKYFNSWEALGLGYIAAFIGTKNKDVEFSFFQGCFDNDETIIAECSDANIVAFSCTTPSYPHALRLARKLKEINPKVRTVVGGYHASSVPTDCLVEGIDQVIVGEGESAMNEIISGNRENIIYGRPMDFSELPWPNRSLIKNERNINVAFKDTGKRITSFQSHRGCPFKCIYCADGFTKVLYRNNNSLNSVRYRQVSDLLNEIQNVTETYKLDLIKFSDSTWNTKIDWVIEFCREKNKHNIAVPFYPNIHAGVCSEKMFNYMAEANCYEIAVGIESGSSKILKQIGKGTTIETIKKCVKWAKGSNILVRGYFILGMPEETEDDLKLTELLADELELDEYGFTILCPYPGTKMYDPKKYASIDWENTDEYSNDFWHANSLNNQRLKDWQLRLTDKYKDKLTWHNRALEK